MKQWIASAESCCCTNVTWLIPSCEDRSGGGRMLLLTSSSRYCLFASLHRGRKCNCPLVYGSWLPCYPAFTFSLRPRCKSRKLEEATKVTKGDEMKSDIHGKYAIRAPWTTPFTQEKAMFAGVRLTSSKTGATAADDQPPVQLWDDMRRKEGN